MSGPSDNSIRTPPPDVPVVIRSFQPCDLAACRKLYVDGLIGGKLADNDTGFDIDHIESAYMRHPGDHFWVAVASGEHSPGSSNGSSGSPGLIVGTIGVQHHEEGLGEIRRLRVATTHRRRGIGSALLETALRFCQQREYLKVTLDTFMDRDPAVQLFRKFHFRHHHTRSIAGKELLYFYLDLYSESSSRRGH